MKNTINILNLLYQKDFTLKSDSSGTSHIIADGKNTGVSIGSRGLTKKILSSLDRVFPKCELYNASYTQVSMFGFKKVHKELLRKPSIEIMNILSKESSSIRNFKIKLHENS